MPIQRGAPKFAHAVPLVPHEQTTRFAARPRQAFIRNALSECCDLAAIHALKLAAPYYEYTGTGRPDAEARDVIRQRFHFGPREIGFFQLTRIDEIQRSFVGSESEGQ